MEHYSEVGIADSVATFRSSPDHPFSGKHGCASAFYRSGDILVCLLSLHNKTLFLKICVVVTH